MCISAKFVTTLVLENAEMVKTINKVKSSVWFEPYVFFIPELTVSALKIMTHTQKHSKNTQKGVPYYLHALFWRET